MYGDIMTHGIGDHAHCDRLRRRKMATFAITDIVVLAMYSPLC